MSATSLQTESNSPYSSERREKFIRCAPRGQEPRRTIEAAGRGKLLTSIEIALEEFSLIEAKIMAEFVQQGAPHFFAKNRVIAAGRRP